jgi:hypothetical protein
MARETDINLDDIDEIDDMILKKKIGETGERTGEENHPNKDVDIEFTDFNYRDPFDVDITWRECSYHAVKVYHGTLIPLPAETVLPYRHLEADKEYFSAENMADIFEFLRVLALNPEQYARKSTYSDSFYVYIKQKEDITKLAVSDYVKSAISSSAERYQPANRSHGDK